MDLERLGTLMPSRLSFARSLIRQMARQRWHITRTHFELDAGGYGEVIYRIQTPNGRYHVVIFSRHLEDEQRTDRVIAEAWDVTFGLIEGDVDHSLFTTLAENVPLQEAGRQHPRLLVISRANKSLRNFDTFVEALAAGQQPPVDAIRAVGYLYRTTAVYGNGKFGIADYGRLKDNPDFQHPFSAQMAAVYVLRQFSIEQVEHLAQQAAPQTAVALGEELQRYLGIGNSTGLGMAPFLIRHPQLINQWISAREQALALAKAQIPTEISRERLLTLCQRARQYLTETEVEDADQAASNKVVVDELDDNLPWLEQVALSDDLWQQLTDWSEAAQSVATQELLNTLLIELYPEIVDPLEDGMAVEEKLDLSPDMPLVQLKQIIETQFDWALQEDFTAPEACHWFWYSSVEKEEPRLGVRATDPGVTKELPLAIAPRVQKVHGALAAFLEAHPQALAIDFLLAEPGHMECVRRIQTMAATHYGEIRANLWHRDMKPMHLLRTKLSFLGANRFDPRGDRWVRVTFFQGAPLIKELNAEPADLQAFDDWSYAIAPTCTNSQPAQSEQAATACRESLL
jgi:hypothetical protein